MNRPHPLGQLSALHQLMTQLIAPLNDQECRTSYSPHRAPLLWYFGRAVYLETRLVRGTIGQDFSVTDPLKSIFDTEPLGDEAQQQPLPPKEHLLDWAYQRQDENLMHLANPTHLPPHPLLEKDRAVHLINQFRALLYEEMLQVLTERQLQINPPFRSQHPLSPSQPQAGHLAVIQGHYRIGPREPSVARDNELPPQRVQLSHYRIDPAPVSNGAYLAFMQDDGYERTELWSKAGWNWRRKANPHPYHWRLDSEARWYGIGVNGAAELPEEEAVTGLSFHEAQAYANWVSSKGGRLTGAIVQHEYQWEVARRNRLIESGRAWEWCANPFQAYTDYQAENVPDAGETQFQADHHCLRGGCHHSQPPIRRISFRHHATIDRPHLFAGTRLVFPPEP